MLGIPGCLALGEWSHHHDYLGHEDLFCVVLLCILGTRNYLFINEPQDSESEPNTRIHRKVVGPRDHGLAVSNQLTNLPKGHQGSLELLEAPGWWAWSQESLAQVYRRERSLLILGFTGLLRDPDFAGSLASAFALCPATTTKGTGCSLVCFLSPGVQSPHPLSHLKPPEPASPSARVCVMAPS